MNQPKTNMNIYIENLTVPQKIAIEDMFRQWEFLGSIGASRWVAFYADGDGNFQPKISVDGLQPKSYGTEEQIQARWQQNEYRIDFDEIAITERHNKGK